MAMSPIIELKNNLLLDEDYIKFEEIYKKENIVDKDLLIKLLDKHHDLFYMFLKINILLYEFDIKGLNSDLKEFKRYKGKVYYIDDLDCVLRFYYSNYTRNQSVFKMMIKDKLVPLKERKLLEMIMNNRMEEQIRPTFDYEVSDV